MPAPSVFNRALRHAKLGNRAEAMRLLHHVVSQDKRDARAHNELGVLYYQQKQLEKAKHCFEAAVYAKPDHARALSNLGACNNDLNNHQQAINCYEKAIAADPSLTDAWSNLGKQWNELREFEHSAYCYYQALKIERTPRDLRGLAMAYRQSGRIVQAKALLEEAIALNPNDVSAHFLLAPLHFYLENYKNALNEYEWRWQKREMLNHAANYPQIFEAPAYNGENLRGKTLLLHTEQGYGDNLLFCRFIPFLQARGCKLVMWCWQGLTTLFEKNFSEIALITNDPKALPPCDFQLSLLSIPVHFDPHLHSLGQFKPYLSSSNKKQKTPEITNRGTNTTLHVGLVWGCDNNGFDYQYKRLDLQLLASLFGLDHVQWHSLQVGSDSQDIRHCQLQHQIEDHSPRLSNFADTATIIDQLDLVVSVDTAVAHLAAAMGKPTWVMLKYAPDWRWHGHGDAPLWYPNAKRYIQSSRGDWHGVVKRIYNDLKQLSTSHCQQGANRPA